MDQPDRRSAPDPRLRSSTVSELRRAAVASAPVAGSVACGGSLAGVPCAPPSFDNREPVVHCEPPEHAVAGDGQEIDVLSVSDERTLEEAGYGYGV